MCRASGKSLPDFIAERGTLQPVPSCRELEGYAARRDYRIRRAARSFAGLLTQGQAQGIKTCSALIGTGCSAACCFISSDADVRPVDQLHIDIRRIATQVQSAPRAHLRNVGRTSGQHRQRDRKDSGNPASTVRHILLQVPKAVRDLILSQHPSDALAAAQLNIVGWLLPVAVMTASEHASSIPIPLPEGLAVTFFSQSCSGQ